jgi:hypothetical protein
LRVTRESGGGEQLQGVTELRAHDAVGAVEHAEIDASGRLLRLEATVGRPGEPSLRVVLDPPSGQVEITSPSVHIEWSVPNDLPWVWVPILTAPASGAPISTPVVGRVTLLAAGHHPAVRLLDLGTLASHAVTTDQLLVSDDDRGMVVVADDYIEMNNGLPSVLHQAALGTRLEPVDSGKQAMMSATGTGCAPIGRP